LFFCEIEYEFSRKKIRLGVVVRLKKREAPFHSSFIRHVHEFGKGLRAIKKMHLVILDGLSDPLLHLFVIRWRLLFRLEGL